MNLALFSSESAGNKDLIRSVRRIITTELQKFVFFLFVQFDTIFVNLDYSKQNDHQVEIITSEHFNGIE